jgi:hypothetical protein
MDLSLDMVSSLGLKDVLTLQGLAFCRRGYLHGLVFRGSYLINFPLDVVTLPGLSITSGYLSYFCPWTLFTCICLQPSLVLTASSCCLGSHVSWPSAPSSPTTKDSYILSFLKTSTHSTNILLLT